MILFDIEAQFNHSKQSNAAAAAAQTPGRSPGVWRNSTERGPLNLLHGMFRLLELGRPDTFIEFHLHVFSYIYIYMI